MLILDLSRLIRKRATKGIAEEKVEEYIEICREALAERCSRFNKRPGPQIKPESEALRFSSKGIKANPKRRQSTKGPGITQEDLD